MKARQPKGRAPTRTKKHARRARQKPEFASIDEMPFYVKIDQVADTLSVSRMHVVGLLDEGLISAIDISAPPHAKKHYRIIRDSVKNFVTRERLYNAR